tara:strand:+ start:37 stop:1038 length:1002 start_codon:yes stop_codon:yes gene_type:complete
MAFLDNSGDIILDAVLTDLGRLRLAEGKFSIVKFALGDEEINYRLFNPSLPVANRDLEIMQTPILEAFTSDQSLLKSRLMSFSRNNLLHMPVMRVNNKVEEVMPSSINNGFVLMADRATAESNEGQRAEAGFLPGVFKNAVDDARFSTKCINVDSGIIPNAGRSVLHRLDSMLLETAYLIKCDQRLLHITLPLNLKNYTAFTGYLGPQYQDDDFTNTYYIVNGLPGVPIVEPEEQQFRNRRLITDPATNETSQIELLEMFQGPLGKVLQFAPRVTQEVEFSDTFFTKLGSTGTNLTYRGNTIANYKFIDTNINIQGMTTGFSLDIPIRIVKKV